MEAISIKTYNQLYTSYFLDHWGEGKSPVTINAKQVKLQGNVLPVIGQKRLGEITKYDVREICNLMKRNKVSLKYIRETWKAGWDICDYGVSIGVMESNPFDKYAPDRAEAEKFKPFTETEMLKIRDTIAQGKYRNLYEFILESGFMKQEALGLYWDDVDFDENTITIRRRYISEQRNFVLKDFAHEKKRTDISVAAMDCLHNERTKQNIRRMLAKKEWKDASIFVFTDSNGHPIEPEAPTIEIRRLAKAAGINRLNLRNLRNQYLWEHANV